MHLKLPIVLLSAFALVAPAISADAKDKGKDKSKDHKEHKADDRKGGHGNDNDGDRGRNRGNGGDKITICHIPPGNPSNRHTITVGESAWASHSAHGDHRGACGRGNNQGGGPFDTMDTNNDGVISAGEWSGDRTTFDRLDRNDDGVVSRREYRR